jgi:hypothetical protein
VKLQLDAACALDHSPPPHCSAGKKVSEVILSANLGSSLVGVGNPTVDDLVTDLEHRNRSSKDTLA